MTKDNNDPYSVSPEGMQGWLNREIADISKASDLRIAEAKGFVDAFSKGEISQEELAERTYEYSCRWGEPLPGVGRSEGMTDEQILARVTETRVRQGALEPDALRRVNSSTSIRSRR